MNLLIKNCRLRGSEELTDIAVKGGKIVEISSGIRGSAERTIDASGRLRTEL
jgi:dihydroorotase-like cyclic amidohydrolase